MAFVPMTPFRPRLRLRHCFRLRRQVPRSCPSGIDGMSMASIPKARSISMLLVPCFRLPRRRQCLEQSCSTTTLLRCIWSAEVTTSCPASCNASSAHSDLELVQDPNFRRTMFCPMTADGGGVESWLLSGALSDPCSRRRNRPALRVHRPNRFPRKRTRAGRFRRRIRVREHLKATMIPPRHRLQSFGDRILKQLEMGMRRVSVATSRPRGGSIGAPHAAHPGTGTGSLAPHCIVVEEGVNTDQAAQRWIMPMENTIIAGRTSAGLAAGVGKNGGGEGVA